MTPNATASRLPLMTKAELSAARTRLVEMMQQIGFGRVDDLVVQDGEPVFNPMPRIIQDIKLGAENVARPQPDSADFTLRSQVIELFAHLTELGNGTVQSIEVRHGLPFRLLVQRSV